MLKVLEIADILSKGTNKKVFLFEEPTYGYVLTIYFISYQGMRFKVYEKDGVFDRIMKVGVAS